MSHVSLSTLEQCLGYAFHDRDLLETALTHVSACGQRENSYQRLEFLGDRVLGLAIAEMLYEDCPQANEGELSRRLAELVRRETCAQVAAEWRLADYVRLGDSEAQSGGAHKVALLADICEAVIGAIFLDSDFDVAASIVRAAFSPHIAASGSALRDPKSALQEWAQGRGLPPPEYRLLERSGPDHAPYFSICAHVDGFTPAEGRGGSKRAAEQTAAAAFLERERILPLSRNDL